MHTTWDSDCWVTDTYSIHYWRTGVERSPFVILHGFGDSNACWQDVAEALSDCHTVYLPDLPGHGRSSRVKPGEHLDLVAMMEAFVPGIGIVQPILLGHSLGADIAAQIAAGAEFPLRALILVDPPWLEVGPPPPGSKEDTQGEPPGRYELWLKEIQTQPLPKAFSAIREIYTDWNEKNLYAWLESRRQLDLNIFHTHPAPTKWWEILKQIPCKTLLVAGDPALGSRLLPETAEYVSREIPDCHVRRVSGAGHYIHFDQPEAFIAIIQSFVRKLPAPPSG